MVIIYIIVKKEKNKSFVYEQKISDSRNIHILNDKGNLKEK